VDFDACSIGRNDVLACKLLGRQNMCESPHCKRDIWQYELGVGLIGLLM
jgi:hypothetical protein